MPMPALGDTFYDTPYAYVLLNDAAPDGFTPEFLEAFPEYKKYCGNFLERRCSYCLKPATELCPQCQVARFCGENCRAAANPDHRIECQAFRSCKNVEARNDPYARLLGRIVARRQRDSGQQKHDSADFYGLPHRSLDQLMSHVEQRCQDTQLPSIKSHFYALFENVPDLSQTTVGELDDLYGKIMTNEFVLNAKPDLHGTESIGIALYLNMSRIDHDCEPDLVWWFENENIVARVICDTGNRQLCDLKFSYCAGFQLGSSNYAIATNNERKEFLKERYCFECVCNLCTDDQLDLQMRTSVHLGRIAPAGTLCCKAKSLLMVHETRTKNGDKHRMLGCRVCKKMRNDNVSRSVASLVSKEIGTTMQLLVDLSQHDYTPSVVCQRCERRLEEMGGCLNLSYNVYNMRIFEWLFASYRRLSFPFLVETSEPGFVDLTEIPGDIRVQNAHLAVQYGEAMLAIGEKYLKPYNAWLATHYGYLGQLTEFLNAKPAAKEWFEKAISAWTSRFGSHCTIVHQLQAKTAGIT